MRDARTSLMEERPRGNVGDNRMPNISVRRCASALMLVSACGTNSGNKGDPNAGLHRTADGWVFSTGDITVQPGEEKYMCYAGIVNEDLSISAFTSLKNPLVHHFMFVETLTPEENGLKECNVLLRPTWSPMYAAATADSEVDIPEGAAKAVPKGKQVLLQVHLLNTTAAALTRPVEVNLTRSLLKNPEKVGIMIFGAENIYLPPHKTTTSENRCVLSRDVRLFSVLPHMHRLGTRLELDYGPDDAHLTTAYTRDPFLFDDQHFDPLTLTLPSGSVVHTHCSFNNDTDKTVTFGETSAAEMCLAVGFNVGGDDLELCSQTIPIPDGGVPVAPDAGVCSESTNSNGIGRFCTPGGSECPNSLLCSADLLSQAFGICFQAGCTSNADCSGTTCCTTPIGNVANICVPEACRPTDCVPVADQKPVSGQP